MSLRFHKSKLVLFSLFLTSSGAVSFTVAQSPKALSTEEVAFTDSEGTSSSSLPDAPGFAADKADAGQRHAQTQTFFMHVAPKYAQVIEPEYQAVPLGAKDKVGYAGREIFSVQFPVGVLVSAGLSQGIDSEPKYGTDGTAFAKKVGAAGARGASQIIFSDGILAPVLHEDPRYYVLGPGHSFSGRLVYAATRVLLTRNDKGANTVNFSALAGYGGSAALTQLYYPVGSRDTGTMLSTYGASLFGLAIQNELQEFFRFFVPHQPKP